MSGGIAYVYDPDGDLPESGTTSRWSTSSRSTRTTVTGSVRHRHPPPGRDRLRRRRAAAGRMGHRAVEEFVKVMPRDYRRVLEATRRAIDDGRSVDGGHGRGALGRRSHG